MSSSLVLNAIGQTRPSSNVSNSVQALHIAISIMLIHQLPHSHGVVLFSDNTPVTL
jgi:hypothetical protein